MVTDTYALILYQLKTIRFTFIRMIFKRGTMGVDDGSMRCMPKTKGKYLQTI